MQNLIRAGLLAFVAAMLSAAAPIATCNTADRSVLLILDGSGSMNARLPNGETRIAVARRAVKGTATVVPTRTRVALRLYGAASGPVREQCQNTQVVVPFGFASTAGPAITKAVDGVTAHGYTPIAYSLMQAANDFPADAKERTIVLVSDGKETCHGDPVVAAKALAAKGIVVHTVGFVVDTAARGQLQAIARAAGGKYFDAPVGPELPDTLRQAFQACKEVVAVARTGPGRLRTTFSEGNTVYNAETEEKVGDFNGARHALDLPAGIYEVQFGPARWKGIVIRAGETTTIDPGQLRIDKAPGNSSVEIVDSETAQSFGHLSAARNHNAVMPGLYDLKFSKDLTWRFIKVDGGTETVISPAVVNVVGRVPPNSRVLFPDGRVAMPFPVIGSSVILPPGEYIVEVGGRRVPFSATEGKVLEVQSQ